MSPRSVPPPTAFSPLDQDTSAFATLGAELRGARKASGRSLAELSVATRVHVRYLTALEEGDFSALPSRVFAIGYVRAYAGALGLDEQSAVERFKRESPDLAAPLQPPVGIAFEDVRRRSQPALIALAVLAVAVIGWNVFQRINLMQAPRASDIASVPESWSLGAVPGQTGTAVVIGGPTAAPADQTTPALYVTPGLEAALTGVGPQDPAVPTIPTVPVQAAFNPRGAVYGAPATASQIVLQARKATSLVVRMADGRVVFARQLAAGEAWRAPIGLSAVAEVEDPAAFDLYLNGEHGGALAGIQTSLSQLNTRAEAMARQTAAHQAATQAAEQNAARLAAQAATPPVTQTAGQTANPAANPGAIPGAIPGANVARTAGAAPGRVQ